MDAHLFRLFASFASPLLAGARIEKIQEPTPGLLTLSLYAQRRKTQLFWHYQRRQPFCFFGTARLGSGHKPSAQVMRLRKYCGDRRIASVVFQIWRRRLWLLPAQGGEFQENGASPWLCLDLQNGPSLHFLESEQAPLEDVAQWPEQGQLEQAMRDWRSWPVLTPKLRKTLASLDNYEQMALMEDLRAGDGNLFLYCQDDGQEKSLRIAAWPLEAKEGEKCLEYAPEDFMQAFEKAGNDLVLVKLYDARQEQLLSPVRKRLKNLRKILANLEEDGQRLAGMCAKLEDGLALRDLFQRLDMNSHRDTVLVQTGAGQRQIQLDARLSVYENMEKFFHEAKRGKRGLRMLQERRASIEAEIASLENATPVQTPLAEDKVDAVKAKADSGTVLSALRGSLPKNVQALVSKDGHVLLHGRDGRGNRAVLRLAQPHDLWLHVEGGQGTHVIIRKKFPAEEIPLATLEEAASIAIQKSWYGHAGQANVMVAEARHVKPARNGPAGKVLIDKLLFTRMMAVR